MNTFSDEFIFKRVSSKLVKEVKQEELKRLVNEISYYNEIKHGEIRKFSSVPVKNELDFLKKLNNAKQNL